MNLFEGWFTSRRALRSRLRKVEAGINGSLPTAWAPAIYSVSSLRGFAARLEGNHILRSAAGSLVPRSPRCPRKTKRSDSFAGQNSSFTRSLERGRSPNDNQ
jgi:hypothetical protein